jgi:hypothetical protein
MEIDNMFVKFENNKAIHIVGILPPEENPADWQVVDNELINARRIIKDGSVIRAATDEEIEAELAELRITSLSRNMRWKRDVALTESDALVLPDRWASWTEAQKTAISTYRQALRDLTAAPTFPEVTLPIAPVL